ncbi:uncharacterized protein EV422DRAFT_500094 [Fimicolochytrium jonesii]|uniref:uncharacterized protein n=1 Tax=Fimicolochytrium jonesii TaxID=1396493 RepID=UPI0022FED0B2|nr:uncharacterized protein EV422DRAFT_500094 [Fimicolochytrium jonesii]KAI8817386.1 hypothetical protein EV422DRAFT_500094 [Fimicolochytrium jonesii]
MSSKFPLTLLPPPLSQHVYITGGSQGTGLALAKLLAARGARITIVARDVAKLEKAVEEIRRESSLATENSEGKQVVIYESADLRNAEGSAKALKNAEERMGAKVDYVFLCAGGAQPGMFIDLPASSLAHEMERDYLTAAYTAHAAITSFTTHPKPHTCRLVFVSSILGLMGLVGYTGYSAAKHAIRGLADSLRMEMQMYGIKIHIFYPGTIYSPGYEEENKTKPAITKKLEEGDVGVTPEKAAEILFRGVEKEQYSIVCDFTGELIRSATKGAAPANNGVMDFINTIIGFIGLTFWRSDCDKQIRSQRKRT